MAQLRTVENRPYADMRPYHFGIFVGTHLQDMELLNAGMVTYQDANGNEAQSTVSVDQDRWNPGFMVGVAGELRINQMLQLRLAPAMYFGTRHLTFCNLTQSDANNAPLEEKQEMKCAYFSAALELIFAAQRFNNHRPYLVAGINPMLNLNSNKDEYLLLKKSDLFLEVGVGCDFYLQFFKLRPELKFLFGLTDALDKNHADRLKDKNMLPYALSAKEIHSKMIALTFYFE